MARNVARKRMRNIWSSMIRRCYDPSHPSFQYYGAKGITVCNRWRSSLDSFIEDIGYIPAPMQIDRISNAGNYDPSNVRVATILQQNNHKSNVRLITFRGKTQNMAAWAKETGLPTSTLHQRIATGWPVELALSAQPIPFTRTRRGWRAIGASDV